MAEQGSKPLAERPSWDEYFQTITREVAARSTCLRRHVGAIIVKDKRILATGYNGSASRPVRSGSCAVLRMPSRTP